MLKKGTIVQTQNLIGHYYKAKFDPKANDFYAVNLQDKFDRKRAAHIAARTEERRLLARKWS